MKNKFIFAVTVFVMSAMFAFASLAATGTWTNETGEWQFVDKDGIAQTNVWAKSGNDWFYMDESGKLATSTKVEDNGNLYYVDDNGKMVVDTWVKINDSDIENRWVYFTSTGKAYKDGWKDVNGQKYFFENSCMNYGFLTESGAMIDEDADVAYTSAVYYCGTEDDGSRKTSTWFKVEGITTDDSDDGFVWLFFGANGKKYVDKTAQINGAKYSFDSDGKMNKKFVSATASVATATESTKYYNADGALVKKGWIWSTKDNDEADEHWYYANNTGDLYKDTVKKINGKYYAFDSDGKMLTGFVEVIDSKPVGSVIKAEDITKEDLMGSGVGTTYMYFTESADPAKQGAAFTGKKTIEVCDETVTINFSTKGIATSSNGEFKVVKGYAYKNDVLYKVTDADHKYEPVTIDGKKYVITLASGKASTTGTFTDSENDVKYSFKDGEIGIYKKDDKNWVFVGNF